VLKISETVWGRFACPVIGRDHQNVYASRETGRRSRRLWRCPSRCAADGEHHLTIGVGIQADEFDCRNSWLEVRVAIVELPVKTMGKCRDDGLPSLKAMTKVCPVGKGI